tara:strand:- start:1204 stop:1590 length:387 start_codon:yes stop_codon:yes gene_type:complete
MTANERILTCISKDFPEAIVQRAKELGTTLVDFKMGVFDAETNCLMATFDKVDVDDDSIVVQTAMTLQLMEHVGFRIQTAEESNLTLKHPTLVFFLCFPPQKLIDHVRVELDLDDILSKAMDGDDDDE